MKVLLLNTYATGGGAAVAAQRMLEGLLQKGVEARMLTAFPPSYQLPYGSEVQASLHRHKYSLPFLLERLELLLRPHLPRRHLFRFSTAAFGSASLASHPWIEWADVIHLHWVQHGLLSLGGLEMLLQQKHKKICWTLHDLWPLTGGCHIPYLLGEEGGGWCSRYLTGCADCPLMEGKRGRSTKRMDATSKLWHRKLQLPLEQVQFFGVSSWVTKEINRYLTRYFPTAPMAKVLPNSYDPTLFAPPVAPSTEEPSERQKLLFVAARLDDPVKGMDDLLSILHQALRLQPEWADRVELHLVGRFKQTPPTFPIPIVHHSELAPSELAGLYRQADFTLSTSRFETFGQTLLESIASGTPAIAFEVGGTSDIIQSGRNGILIPPFDLTTYATHLLAPARFASPDEVASTAAPFQQEVVTQELLQLYS